MSRERINKEIEQLNEQLQMINDRFAQVKASVDKVNNEGTLTGLSVKLERVVWSLNRARFHMGVVTRDIKHAATS